VSSDPNTGAWSDKLTIETPEQTVFDFPLAGVGSRCLAMLLDTIIQGLGFLILGLLAEWSTALDRLSSIKLSIWFEAIAIFIAFSIYYGYFAFFEAIWNGQTPGKRWTHLRVIHESGRPIAVPQAILRNLVRFVDQLPGVYAVGLTTALISRQNRRLGDIVAGTVVVHERPLEKGSAPWAEPVRGVIGSGSGATSAAANAAPLGGSVLGAISAAAPVSIPAANVDAGVPTLRWGVARLTGEDVRLLNSFLERRYTLDMQTRDKLARQIGERLAERLGVTFEQRRNAGQARYEDFLDALARERQS
jgi:uncharacterized RDD family membrane protein YckC